MLVEDDRAIVGVNIFTDYEINSKHKRASLGLEYQRSNFSLTANKYHPLSNKVVIGDYNEEALSGRSTLVLRIDFIISKDINTYNRTIVFYQHTMP
jgi:hypothetical protein